ncbi:glycoside hydrolase family 6 protein [Amycolatopsis rubida]|uniref:Endoglucanase n=1 Tax=Amycolatopsis rubida TaxID=112413 RepID=A0A1I5ZCF3_9PSEU|nr:glycoside hydrolase family 6 protein [Amycolatopsis rubida]SFQ54112.1 endoglucanase [Amycolatopsis rubida]
MNRLGPILLAVLLLVGGCVDLPGEAGPPPASRLLAGTFRLARDPESPAAIWTRQNAGGKSPAFEPIQRDIAYTPVAHRFTAADVDLSQRVRDYLAQAAKQRWMPMLVAAFTEPGVCPAERSPAVGDLARGLGDGKAIVVLEPRLLGGQCADTAGVTRYLNASVRQLRAEAPNAFVFLDVSAGGTVDEQRAWLISSGVAQAAGVTFGVGDYTPAAQLAGPARKLHDALAAATGRSDYFLLADSSRNGAVVTGTCNPAGARIGPDSVLSDQPGALQQAWLTVPGVSDGPCGAAPASRAGEFVPDLARQLTG